MITVESFFSGTLNTVDAIIGDFVRTAYLNFVQANSEVITLLFTLYVMLMGYQFLTHTLPVNLNVIMRRIIVMLCVYALIMNWQLYNLFVYRIFTTEPGNIAQIFVDTAGNLHPTGSISHALDSIYSSVMNATWGFLGQVSFSAAGIAFILYAGIVALIGSALCIFALVLFVYAKMMMAVSLALGPLFILFILWEPTKGMFSAWLSKLITIALIPVVTTAILVLMLSVINVTLPNINQQPTDIQFYGIAPFLGLCLTTTLILSQVFRICSALGGGITLASVSQGVAIGRSALQNSGVAYAGRAAASWGGKRASHAVRRVFKNNK